MESNINYINVLPNFLAMQRISFCWFITHGLTEELAIFSKIQTFDPNVECTIFSEEYSLMKPASTLLNARKYNSSYQAQLIIPIEVRRKRINSIRYENQISVIKFPLMTNIATFVINGCERVVISQIIRSPGVYFEKDKIQKVKNKFKRKLSTDVNKLQSFIPFGEIRISEFDLFFTTPTIIYNSLKKQNKIAPSWENGSIYYYSIKYLQKIEKIPSQHFLEYFKLYRIITQIKHKELKDKIIVLFLKWIKFKMHLFSFKTNEIENLTYDLLKYFNILLISIVKYKSLQQINIQNTTITKTNEQQWLKNFIQCNNLNFLINNSRLPEIQFLNLIYTYAQLILKIQDKKNLKLNSQFIISQSGPTDFLTKLNSFSILKNQFKHVNAKLKEIISLINTNKLRPVIYFPVTLKDQLKYIFGKNTLEYKKDHHKYLKTKTQFLLHKKNHKIITNYSQKYNKKKLYTAIIIPEHGSWIRFNFQNSIETSLSKYPLKYQEDQIFIQLDKIDQKPAISLLKEIGLTDLEIYHNLENANFFYFNEPLLLNSDYSDQPITRSRLNNNTESISEFTKIFDLSYYKLGKIGRLKFNNKLNLKSSNRLQSITYEDIFAILDKLINISISNTLPDDIDHLKNRRVRSVGELFQNLLRTSFQRLVRRLKNQTSDTYSNELVDFNNAANISIKEFFNSSQLSQYMDQTNPLSSLTHRRRISALGPGGLEKDHISFAVRAIHPSHYGRICPIETPEGQSVGLIASLTTCAKVNKLGFLETPFWRVINGKVIKTSQPIYLTAEVEDFYKIAPADIAINNENYLIKSLIPVRHKQDFINVSPAAVDFIAVSTVQVVSIAASLIPFFEHDDANRALMGSNMQRQAVPLILAQKPIVGTGLENQIAGDSGLVLYSQVSGKISSVTANRIIIKDETGKKERYNLQKYLRSNQQTCISQRPIIWKGEKIKAGQILTDGPAITNSELSLGQNVLVGYMPWQGYNFEDAIVISERLVYDDIFTSIHISRYIIKVKKDTNNPERITKDLPDIDPSEVKNLNDNGIVKVGTFVRPGDILVGKIILNVKPSQSPTSRLLRVIYGLKAHNVEDSSYKMKKDQSGRIIETVIFNKQKNQLYAFDTIYIFIAKIRKIQVGDKIAGRHGNKGIISRILPRQDMPFLPDGTPIDIILNPLGVPSRMNVGQLYECLLGLSGDKLNARFKILPFDEMYGLEISRILINKKLRQASISKNESWLFNPYAPGKMVLIDGRTGIEFENPVTVGNAYMLKLIHLVDDKMHARATGPYSLITQQPVRGKAQYGGQRFGEMEVWALEGFGAAFTLKELLTVKSDDITGRDEMYYAITRGKPLPQGGIPESFKVLMYELRSIGLDIGIYQVNKFSSSSDGERALTPELNNKTSFPTEED